jgi:hypothetical protein
MGDSLPDAWPPMEVTTELEPLLAGMESGRIRVHYKLVSESKG